MEAKHPDGWEHVVHGFAPVYDARSRVLVLGTLPSVKSREAAFYYGHPRNRFWAVLAAVFDAPVPQSTDEKKALLLSSGVALWDVVGQCDIRRSADSTIRNVVPNDLAPILLFNEADAILGTRMEGAVKSVDRMENSVQNILLQEMESFEGIMIATTNLLGNLDPAFERRFLFKIRFSRPELEPRALIWKSQFPSLTDDEARLIAGEFPFSGGQIENVVRKYTIDGILSGEEGGYDALRQYCREESVGRQTARKIGF